MSNVETMEEYQARGGSITHCKPGNGVSLPELIKKDAQLKALRMLRVSVSEESIQFEIDSAIQKRYEILKGCW